MKNDLLLTIGENYRNELIGFAKNEDDKNRSKLIFYIKVNFDKIPLCLIAFQ